MGTPESLPRLALCAVSMHNVGYHFSHCTTAWKAAGLQPVGHLVWTKNYHSTERFVRYSHEFAYLLAKGNPPRPRIALRGVLDWRYTGDVLHPTQKPVMALLSLILAYSKIGDIVLDPFAGSGTTAVAAQALGRRYIGIELEPNGSRGFAAMGSRAPHATSPQAVRPHGPPHGWRHAAG